MKNIKPSIGTLLLTMINAFAFSQTKKPNILVIMGDDIGLTNLGCYGGDIMGVLAQTSIG
jgi:hypothetical protein